MPKDIVEDFIYEIHRLIGYWDKQENCSSKEKMEGLAHSILVLLDGNSGSWSGDISILDKYSKNLMLHDQLWEKKDFHDSTQN